MNHLSSYFIFSVSLLFPSQITFAQSDYPIDLLKNQQWKIEVTPPKNDVIDMQYIFEVSRNKEHFDAVAYEINSKTGEKTRSLDDFTARFIRQYPPTDKEFLELNHCWWKYENIHEGFTCLHFRIPTEITEKDIKGDAYNYSSLLTGTHDNFQVVILEKDKNEIDCNIRGEIYENQKLYYTRASEEYEDLGQFACFETETAAQTAGYRLNFGEGGMPLATKFPNPSPASLQDHAGLPSASEAPVSKTETERLQEAEPFVTTFSDISSSDDNYDAIG